MPAGEPREGPLERCNDSSPALPRAKDPLIGTLFEERYEIIEFLGCGAMGSVYRGRHVLLDKDVAIKILHPYLVSDRAALKRFCDEGRLAAALDHEGIVQILASGVSGQALPFLVMDFVRGQSLAVHLAKNGPLNRDRALKIICQACDALQHAHEKGLVHRDIKPANIMIEEGSDRVKIVDFGVARLYSGEMRAAHESGANAGSPLYMSPEQLCGITADARADIYSLACTLHEALTGSPPFTMDSIFARLGAVRHTLSPEDLPALRPWPAIAVAVARALQPDPLARFAGIREFKEALLSAPPLDIATSQDKMAKRSARLPRKALIYLILSAGALAALSPFLLFTAPQGEEFLSRCLEKAPMPRGVMQAWLWRIAEQWRRKGRYIQAANAYQKWAHFAIAALPQDAPQVTALLIERARLLQDEGASDLAEALNEEAMRILIRALRQAVASEDIDRAFALLEQRSILQKKMGLQPELPLSSLYKLGKQVEKVQHNYRLAARVYSKCLQRFEADADNAGVQITIVLQDLARVLRHQNDLRGAEHAYLRLVQWARSKGKAADILYAERRLSEFYLLTQRPSAAEPHLKAIMAMPDNHLMPVTNLIDVIATLAASLEEQGKLGEAAGLRQRLLLLTEKTYPGDVDREAEARMKLFITLFRMGDQDKALRALEPLKKYVDRRRLSQTQGAGVLHQLGGCYLAKGRPREAARLHEEAVRLREKIGDPRGTAEALLTLGNSWLQADDMTKAAAAYRKAEQLIGRLSPVPPLLSLHGKIGRLQLQLKQGRLEGMVPAAEAIVVTCARDFGKDSAEYGHCLALLARCCQNAGDWPRAAELYKQSAEVFYKSRGLSDKAFNKMLALMAQCLRRAGRSAEAAQVLARYKAEIKQ